MNNRINTFMKDCAWFRAFLYFSIAALPALITDISKYKTLSDISPVALIIIVANILLQGFIAVRAYLDQSITRIQKDKKDGKKVDLINE
jgi:hypothetical protein